MENHATVLLVDDSDTIRDVLSAVLNLEFDIVAACSGQDALDLARDLPVDIILLDVVMPEMDGYETCRRLKADAVTRDIPVIFMTASTLRTRLDGFACGGIDFVEKPGDDDGFAEVCARLHAHVTLRRQQQQLEEKHRQLQIVQQQLVQQEKLASLGELMAGISHEIRNPLNFVVNFSQVVIDLIASLHTELAKSEAERDHEELSYVLAELPETAREIKTNGERAVRIVQGMLEHSRGERGTRQPTNLNLLVTEYVRLAYHGLRAIHRDCNAELEFDLSATLERQPVALVPQEISRAIVNIASNGLQAVRDKWERLCPATAYRPALQVSTGVTEEQVRIIIRDNGNGIPMEIREKIFEPFFTTKPPGEGTGLGLSMAYDIVVKGHGGELRCDSKEGEWTEFELVLPKGREDVE